MRDSIRNISGTLLLLLACIVNASQALAGESTMSKGSLSVEGPDKSLSVTLTHAYYITGIDRFDETKTVRSIVFTTDDQRAAIDECEDLSCAMLSSSDGLKIDLDESGMINWWAHISPVQYSSMASGDALVLRVDKPDRLAGTFKLGSSSTTTAIEFDASLVKDFSKE